MFLQKITARGDKMEKRKEKAAEEKRSILEVRTKRNTMLMLKLAKEKASKLNTAFTLVSLIGPITISLLYLFFTIDVSALVWWHLVVDVVATFALIISLIVLAYKLDVAQRVVILIETSKESYQKRIEALEKRNELLEGDQSFYISATQLLGQAMKDGKKNIEELSKVLVAVIYHNLSHITKGDNITINLYESRNEKIRMILSTTRLHYCERGSVDIPVLYQSKTGLDIKDGSIQEYYCIKCIRGKIKGRDGKYVVSDWKKIARDFKWDGWTAKEKEKILNDNDSERSREKSIELGFKYNQYFSFKIRRDDGILILFEIIANGKTTIAPTDEIDRVTHRLRETYSPLISILWDISDFSPEKE